LQVHLVELLWETWGATQSSCHYAQKSIDLLYQSARNFYRTTMVYLIT
jgi:hypothetical protein